MIHEVPGLAAIDKQPRIAYWEIDPAWGYYREGIISNPSHFKLLKKILDLKRDRQALEKINPAPREAIARLERLIKFNVEEANRYVDEVLRHLVATEGRPWLGPEGQIGIPLYGMPLFQTEISCGSEKDANEALLFVQGEDRSDLYDAIVSNIEMFKDMPSFARIYGD